MVSYETIPADPAAEHGLLAKPKPNVSLSRVLGAAAITSFILGAIAATALPMPAGVPQTMLKGDPYCTDDNAHADSSALSNKLNKAMNEENGFIFRFRFDGQIPCNDDGHGWQTKSDSCGDLYKAGLNGGVAATVLSNQVHTENPVYCINNEGHGCDSASVGYALLDNWSGSKNPSSDSIGGYAYYATDSNSVDQRDWKTNVKGLPGQGCHGDQQQYLGEWGNGMITYNSGNGSPSGDSYCCMCDYENFNPKKVGDLLVQHIANSPVTSEYTSDGIPVVTDDYIKPLDGKLQPMYYGQDLSSCWIDENGPWQNIFDMQNSLYDTRHKWWNGAIGGNPYPDPNWDNGKWYPGWNLCGNQPVRRVHPVILH